MTLVSRVSLLNIAVALSVLPSVRMYRWVHVYVFEKIYNVFSLTERDKMVEGTGA